VETGGAFVGDIASFNIEGFPPSYRDAMLGFRCARTP
jgi:hypothetical protein